MGGAGVVSRQRPAPVGREQGRRQAERRAEPGALLKLRQSLPGSGCCGGKHGAPETWLDPGSTENQYDCEQGPAPPIQTMGGRFTHHSTTVQTGWETAPCLW